MPRPCSVCCRTDKLSIDVRLLRGDTATSIASEYNLKIDAVLRHKANHLKKPSESSSSVTMLKQVILELDGDALIAMAKGDVRATIDARKRKSDAIEVLMQHESAEAKAAVDNSSLEDALKKIPVETLDRIVASVKAENDRCPLCGSFSLPKATKSPTGQKSGNVQ
jgi:hypothetical protein